MPFKCLLSHGIYHFLLYSVDQSKSPDKPYIIGAGRYTVPHKIQTQKMIATLGLVILGYGITQQRVILGHNEQYKRSSRCFKTLSNCSVLYLE